jgi:hypothetical protein
MKNIVDSNMTAAEILAQNPRNPAPTEVLENLEIVTVEYFGFDNKKHRGQIVMHKDWVSDVKEFFAEALRLQFPIEKVIPISHSKYLWDDERSCEDNNSSGYNYRIILGTNRLSRHANGLAFDINPVQNIYIRHDEKGNETYRSPKNGMYDKNAKGTLTQGHPLVSLMRQKGWMWGGDWKKEDGVVDYQHFEKST